MTRRPDISKLQKLIVQWENAPIDELGRLNARLAEAVPVLLDYIEGLETQQRVCNPIADYNWRQHTPKSQLVVLAQSVWGTLDNMIEGCTDVKIGAERIFRHAQELQYLVPHLLAGDWGLIKQQDDEQDEGDNDGSET